MRCIHLLLHPKATAPALLSLPRLRRLSLDLGINAHARNLDRLATLAPVLTSLDLIGGDPDTGDVMVGPPLPLDALAPLTRCVQRASTGSRRATGASLDEQHYLTLRPPKTACHAGQPR